MSAVKPIVPWVLDPLGTLVTKTTGIPTIGGVVDRKINPPTRPTPQPAAQPAAAPKIGMPSISGPSLPKPPAPTGPQVPPATAAATGDDKGATGSGADVTKGLLVRKRNATLLA